MNLPWEEKLSRRNSSRCKLSFNRFRTIFFPRKGARNIFIIFTRIRFKLFPVLIHCRLTGYFEFLSTHTNSSGRRILSYERSNNSRTGRRTTRANSKSLSGRVNRSKQAARRTRLFEKYFFFRPTARRFQRRKKKKKGKKDSWFGYNGGGRDRKVRSGGEARGWREQLAGKFSLPARTRNNSYKFCSSIGFRPHARSAIRY